MGQYYLATTGISEIWEPNNKLLLLGPWCIAGEKNRRLLRARDYSIVPSPWKPSFKVKHAADYCQEIYENVIAELFEGLNFIHNVSYPVKYWRILLGYWLLLFIEVFYDRYKRIERALDIFPDLFTHVLPLDQCNPVSFDTYDFHSINGKINEDYYNLILFSLAAFELCPDKIIESEVTIDCKIGIREEGWKKRLFYNLIEPLNTIFKCQVVLSDMGNMSPKDMLLLKLRTGVNTISLKHFKSNRLSYNNNYSHSLREMLTLKGASDRFQSLLYKTIPCALPMCYMENYKSYRNSVNGINHVKKTGSATGWYFNEEFKFFAAEAASKGAALIDFQHGSGYGMGLSVPHEAICLEKDVFYTWGWNTKGNGKTIPLPCPSLTRLRDRNSCASNNILFVSTSSPRYHCRFDNVIQPDDMSKYFCDKKIFFQTLQRDIRDEILYRPNIQSGWGEIETIKEAYPELRIIPDGRLTNWMRKVKLVVIDHPHTSFLEALTINVPCIFFWDHDVYLMRPEAEEYFALLRDAGIVYKDPESAAKKVNEIYHNPQSWWKQPAIQEARERFCRRFALTSKDWLNEWAETLKSL